MIEVAAASNTLCTMFARGILLKANTQGGEVVSGKRYGASSCCLQDKAQFVLSFAQSLIWAVGLMPVSACWIACISTSSSRLCLSNKQQTAALATPNAHVNAKSIGKSVSHSPMLLT